MEQLLNKAKIITEEKGIQQLVEIITIDHDTFLNQLNKWEDIIGQKTTLKEIVKLTQVENLLERMIHKKKYQKKEAVLDYASKARELKIQWQKSLKKRLRLQPE